MTSFLHAQITQETEEEQYEYKTKQKEEICSTQGKSESTLIVSPWIIGWFSLEELS